MACAARWAYLLGSASCHCKLRLGIGDCLTSFLLFAIKVLHMPTEASQLIVKLKGNVVQTVPLTMKLLTIGRFPDNGLVLNADLVSRYHAELRIEPEGSFLT